MCHAGNIGQTNWMIVSKTLIAMYRCYSPTEPLLLTANCYCSGSPWSYRVIRTHSLIIRVYISHGRSQPIYPIGKTRSQQNERSHVLTIIASISDIINML